MKIHTAIIAAMADIAKTGIAKASRNKDQGYNFRGIEDAMNELSPILTRHGITVTPAYSDLIITERPSKSGGVLRFVTIRGAFTFGCDIDSITSYVYGEAMDSSDKAVTKAQSVAFRTALFQQFVVPTMAMDPEVDDDEGDPLLDQFQAAALAGTKALQALFKSAKPEAKFWAKHSQSLKAAAELADKEAA